MTRLSFAVGIVCVFATLTAARAANAPVLDLDSCHDDLYRVRRIASDASDFMGNLFISEQTRRLEKSTLNSVKKIHT
jgi:hypothetical protein